MRTVKNFVERLGLVSLWSEFSVAYTHLHTDGKIRSTIDHFLVTPRLMSLVEKCGIVERGDNLSRHCPIWVKFRLGDLPLRSQARKWLPRKPCWSKASSECIDAYTADLHQNLLSKKIPASVWCSDPQCSDKSHCQERDALLISILEDIVKSSYSTLPVHGGRWIGGGNRSSSVPGWALEVEPFRAESVYWGDVWKKEGRPNVGWLHSLYAKKRAQYHQAVKKAKAKADRCKAENLLAAALTSDIALLHEMKMIRKGGRNLMELPDTVAGANGELEIVEKFRLVYSTLYNSAGTEEEMVDLRQIIGQLVTPTSLCEVEKITGNLVKSAACTMKPRKSDVSNYYTSDALLNAPDILFELLATIFRSWLIHGNITSCVLACSFLPLLKSALKDPADTGSYRAIAGSSLILKLFEKVVLMLWGHHLGSDSLQFGFKAGTSTTQCTWLVSKVVQHLLKNGTNPIVTVLDCSNGTRQGAVLYPAFWAVYCDLMIKELRNLGVGAHIAGISMGVACYADDVVLIRGVSRNFLGGGC